MYRRGGDLGVKKEMGRQKSWESIRQRDSYTVQVWVPGS